MNLMVIQCWFDADLIVIKWDSGFVLTNFSHLLGTTEGTVIKHGFVHGVVQN